MLQATKSMMSSLEQDRQLSPEEMNIAKYVPLDQSFVKNDV